MGSISSIGIGSGLDIQSIINSLVNAERAPAEERLIIRESGVQAKLTGLGTLKSALSDWQSAVQSLQSRDAFDILKSNTSDPDTVQATIKDGATVGQFDIIVDQLARGSRLQSAAFSSSDQTFAEGTLTFTAGDKVLNLDISENDTLADIREKINDASDNFGIEANIINTNDGAVLVLDSSVTGAGNDLTITSTDPALQDIAENLSISQASQDAEIQINGLALSSDTNTFESAISGIDLTVSAVSKSEDGSPVATTVEINQDNSAIKGLVEKFIDKYNDLTETMSSLRGSGEQAGILTGDSTLRQLDFQLKRIITTPLGDGNTAISTIASLGITTDETGKLTLDEKTFNEAIDKNFDDVVNLFAGTEDAPDGGLGSILDVSLTSYTQSSGLIDLRTDSLNTQLDRISDDRAALKTKLDNLETRLRAQFGAMDSLVAGFNSTQNFLSQQLQNLPGFNSVSRGDS